MKHFDEHSGVGGDWAVRVNVTKTPETEDKPWGSPPMRKRRRISLVMYLTDEDKPTQPWQVRGRLMSIVWHYDILVR